MLELKSGPLPTTQSGVATQAAPDSLIDVHGRPLFGHFDGPPKSLGLADFQLFNEMDRRVSRLKQRCSYKQFEFIGLNSPRWMLGVALADIAYLGSGFCYLFDLQSRRMYQQNLLRPPAGFNLSRSPWQGESRMGGIHFRREQGQWQLSLDLKLQGMPFEGELTLVPEPLSLPMALCSPTGYSGWTYTQKHNALKVSGQLSFNHEPQPLLHARAGYDFSAGFMRRETSWRWASINADIEGKGLGLNLAAGVNETGSCENVLWVDGARHLLSPVHFEFDRRAASGGQWRVWSERGDLELAFSPLGCRSERLNLGLLKSNFRQYTGLFSGWVRDSLGKRHELVQQSGLTEDHFAKW
ncbi:DUF2804 domain-containing protein [Shewanella algae]|uniref:DUF2804 domain-containing protein n=1 Tax=Shewanella algae TaxID=38313 RepID=UPI00313E4FCB